MLVVRTEVVHQNKQAAKVDFFGTSEVVLQNSRRQKQTFLKL